MIFTYFYFDQAEVKISTSHDFYNHFQSSVKHFPSFERGCSSTLTFGLRKSNLSLISPPSVVKFSLVTIVCPTISLSLLYTIYLQLTATKETAVTYLVASKRPTLVVVLVVV